MEIKKNPTLNKTILTSKEAGNYLGLKMQSLYKLTHCRKIPFYCPNGKKIYFKRDDLDAWMLQNRVNTIDEVNQQAEDYMINKMVGGIK